MSAVRCYQADFNSNGLEIDMSPQLERSWDRRLLRMEQDMPAIAPVDSISRIAVDVSGDASGTEGGDFMAQLGVPQSTADGGPAVAHADQGGSMPGVGYQSGAPAMSPIAAAALIPRLQTPPPQIMEKYTPQTLSSFDSDGPDFRRYGTTSVKGDAGIRRDYAAIRYYAVSSGRENQKVLATVENDPTQTVFVEPYRMQDKPLWEPTTYPFESGPVVMFGVDQGLVFPGGTMPPPIVAMHELAHAADPRTQALTELSMGEFTNAAEERVINGPEAEALAAIGLPRRDSHTGFIYQTTGITRTEAAVPGVQQELDLLAPRLEIATDLVRQYVHDMRDTPEPVIATSPTQVTSAATALGYRNELMRQAYEEVMKRDGRWALLPSLS
jgi:hypothetical protein